MSSRCAAVPRLATLLAGLLALPAQAAPPPPSGHERIELIGRHMRPSGPPYNFAPHIVHITVSGLPAGWAGGSNLCRTAKPGDFAALRFNFSDGITNSADLRAHAYVLTSGQFANLPVSRITICRDATGALASATAEVAYLGSSGGALILRGVSAVNTAPGSGSSTSFFAGILGSHGISYSATASAPNFLRITN